MELQAMTQDTSGAQDEREWELADEDLDRTGDGPVPRGTTTSRPCSTSRCHCR